MRRTRTLVASALGLIVMAALTVPAVAATAVTSAGAPLTNAWPRFGHDPLNSGFSPDPLISDTNAATLGVRWMANTARPALSSPVVAWNATLGATLVFQGNEGGYFTAYNETTGAVVWSVNLGSAIRTTPVVEGTNVWVAPTYGGHMYKLDTTTGATECAARYTSITYASPVFGTPPGGQPTIYFGVNPQGTVSGPVYAFSETNCATEWQFSKYNKPAGVWDPLSYGTDVTGRALVLFGTADPDESVYALDASTGALVWRFQTAGTGDIDVGAGVDIAPPGTNGFADGVAYVPGKDGNMYALNLSTGAAIWSFNFYADSHVNPMGSISTPALVGNQVLFGFGAGVYALNATTGAKMWVYNDGGTPVDSAVAVVGSSGHLVAAFTTLGGQFQVVRVSDGALIYSHQTGNYVTASPADVDGNLVIASSDGFLYDFAPGGGNGGAPTTAVTSPENGTTIANPNGSLTISGTASDPIGVASVSVAVQEDGSTGSWWNATAGQWTAGPANVPTMVADPGATTTAWSVTVPAPARGTEFTVFASAVASNGVADISSDGISPSTSRASFTIMPSTTAPLVTLSAGRVAPGGRVTVSGSGFGPGESVSLTLPTAVATVLATVTATTTGTIPPKAVTLPTATDFGPTSLLATGATTGRVGSAAIYVSNDWSQYGYNAARTAYEPNDTRITKHVTITSNSFLVQAWAYPSSAAIESSPAVSAGVAYFGNDAGEIDAVNVLTGAPLWTQKLGSTNKITSSPAVVGGLVIFGTGFGNVVALHAADGSQAWTTPTGASVGSSPAVTGGVVYVGSDAGTLVALNEATGHVLWRATLGGQVRSSPAVDPTAKVAVVGDSNGTVTAVSTDTGNTIWSYTTGGPVSATPVVYAGRVFIGSADGSIYALDEATGKPVWTFATGGSVEDSAALSQSDVAVGSDAGTIYFLNRATGAVDNMTPVGSPVVGLSFVDGVLMGTLGDGKVIATRPPAGYLNWHWQSPSGFASRPVIVNGVVYVTSEDGFLYAFAVPGDGLA